jgi:hypothetical protein
MKARTTGTAKTAIPTLDLKRLLRDSKESTDTALEEGAFIKYMLECMIDGEMSYDEALQSTQSCMKRYSKSHN